NSLLNRMRLGTKVIQSEKRVSRTDDTPYSFSTHEDALPIYDQSTNQLLAAVYMVRYQSPYQSQYLAGMRDSSQQMTLSLLRTRSYDEMKQEKQKTEQVLDSIREAIIYLEDGNDELYVNRPLFELIPELQTEFTTDRTLSSASYVIEVMR